MSFASASFYSSGAGRIDPDIRPRNEELPSQVLRGKGDWDELLCHSEFRRFPHPRSPQFYPCVVVWCGERYVIIDSLK
jgi:hypothetical protein